MSPSNPSTARLLIGNENISGLSSAILQLETTLKAFYPPRMTNTQMQAITSPVSGAMVYNTTSGAMCVYNSVWNVITAT